MGLVRLETGDVRLFGDAPDRARRTGRVAYAPQSEDVDWAFPISVEEVVTMGRYGQLGWRRRTREEDRLARHRGARAGGALRSPRPPDRRALRRAAQRAFVARGLAQGADLLFLDEPFAGVDKRSEATLTQLLRDLAAEGRTIVVSTHDLVAVPALCDQVALINRRIIAHGDVDETLRPDLLAEAFGGSVPQEALRA